MLCCSVDLSSRTPLHRSQSMDWRNHSWELYEDLLSCVRENLTTRTRKRAWRHVPERSWQHALQKTWPHVLQRTWRHVIGRTWWNVFERTWWKVWDKWRMYYIHMQNTNIELSLFSPVSDCYLLRLHSSTNGFTNNCLKYYSTVYSLAVSLTTPSPPHPPPLSVSVSVFQWHVHVDLIIQTTPWSPRFCARFVTKM